MRRGFTILEILITLLILVVGLLPIFALFPLGQQRAAEVTRDCYASLIVQGVRDSIELALAKARVTFTNGTRGFVYMGEGVRELLAEQGKSLPSDLTYDDGDDPSIDESAHYWVKLPTGNEKFLYPRHRPNQYAFEGYVNNDSFHPKVRKVFPMGYRIKQIAEKGKDPDDPYRKISDKERQEAKDDPLPGYSYAFLIREAKKDTNDDGVPDTLISSDHNIYLVTVFIYRNFRKVENWLSRNREDLAFKLREHRPYRVYSFYVTH